MPEKKGYLKNKGVKATEADKAPLKEEIQKKTEAMDQVTMSKEELAAFIDQAVETRLKAFREVNTAPEKTERDYLKELVEELKGKDNPLDLSVAVDESELDPSDVLEKPKVYYTVGRRYIIRDDVRNGAAVKTPYGRKFDFGGVDSGEVLRFKEGSGRFATNYYISTCRVYSKKEIEWLERHSLFNIKFFPKLDGAKGVDAMVSTYTTQAAGEINPLTPDKIINRARQEGIEITSDVTQMKRDLIFKIAKRYMEADNANRPKGLSPDYDAKDVMVDATN